RLDALVMAGPSLAYRVNPTPCRVQLVATHEEGQVALHHVHDQALVSVHRLFLEGPGEVERQIHWLQPHGLPWHLRQDGEGNALLRLQPDDQSVGHPITATALEN